MTLLRIWNNYWFRQAPLANLAIGRIILVAFQIGTLFAENVLFRLARASALPDSLYQPISTLEILIWPLGQGYRPSLLELQILFWFTIGVGFFALLGVGTKFSLTLFTVGSIVIQAYLYSFGEIHHSEALLMLAFVALIFSPSGAVLSVDNLLARIRHNQRQGRFERFNPLQAQSALAYWPMLLMLWLFGLIYLSAALSKVVFHGGPTWLNGYTLQFYLLADGMQWERGIGPLLAQFFVLVLVMSWFTIIFEATFFLVPIFPRLAWIYLPMGAMLHLGIFVAMKANFFPYLALYCLFIPWTRVINLLAQRIDRRYQGRKLTVFYDGGCPLCIRTMTVFAYCDWFERLRLHDLEQHWPLLADRTPEVTLDDALREMHVILPGQTVVTGFAAMRAVALALPLLWPLGLLACLPPVAAPGPRIYQAVAGHHGRFARCTSETSSLNQKHSA